MPLYWLFFVYVSFGKDENTANADLKRNIHIDTNFIILLFSKESSLYFILEVILLP